jgi:hypothetical protein
VLQREIHSWSFAGAFDGQKILVVDYIPARYGVWDLGVAHPAPE